ncbi:MAG: transposase, partial [Vulcanimicrobiota bacterium]
MAKLDKTARDDYDSPWREALAFYLHDFFDFFFPKISKKIDWSRPQTFLDSTLRQMEREAKLGRREADALIRLFQVDGGEAWVLVHIEIQAQPDPDFAHRMFISHYRIYDSFRRPLCSLAILADKSKTWRPKSYTRQHWDTTISLKFPTRKLQDYNTPERLARLEKSTNPFAHLVAATLYAQQTRPDS